MRRWNPFCAERTLGRRVGRNLEAPQRFDWDVQVGLAAGAIDEHRRSGDLPARRPDRVDRFLDRSAGGHDVVDHDDAFAGPKCEPAAELTACATRAALRVDRAHAELSADLVGENDPSGRRACHGFDVERVAALTPDDVERLAADQRIIRNRRKIEATIDNAQAVLALDEDTAGGFGAWLGSRGGFEETLDAVREHFRFLGDFGTYYLLYVVKIPVPPHEEARAVIEARRR